jgi:hypothetical protein
MTNPFTTANRLNWDERVDIHLRDTGEIYPIDAFRSGADTLMPIEAGLTLEFLHEHDSLPWAHVPMMRQGEDRMFRLPDDVAGPPLAFSLSARKSPPIAP